MHSTADSWRSEFHVAFHLEHSSRATNFPPTAGTPFEPATIRAASSETGICHPSSPAFFLTGQIEYREVDEPWPDVEDLRESPALEIVAALIADGAEVAYYDPWCPIASDGLGGALASLEDPTSWDADLVILHTRHSAMDVEWLGGAPAVLDTTYRLRAGANVTRL
jgi:UDP-glucose/GDP-mannose dehydrogenase family, UDP binding domain